MTINGQVLNITLVELNLFCIHPDDCMHSVTLDTSYFTYGVGTVYIYIYIYMLGEGIHVK